jgi:hypothetical protein
MVEAALLGRHVAQVRASLNEVAVGALNGTVEPFDHGHGFLFAKRFAQPVAQGLYLRVIFHRGPISVIERENVCAAGPAVRKAVP